MNCSTPRYLGDVINPTEAFVDPHDFSYFVTLTDDQWRRSKSLARQSMTNLSDGPYAEYIKSHGPVEKAGEFVFKSYLDYYCSKPYDVFFTDGNDYSPGFSVSGVTIDVHTRMLKRSTQGNTSQPALSAKKFLLMVPELGLARRADIYVFCGYSTESKDGYAFGWLTANELAVVDMSADIRHSAKCVSIYDVHPIGSLLNHIASR